MFKDWHATHQEQPTKKTWGFGICCCVRQQHHQQMNPARNWMPRQSEQPNAPCDHQVRGAL